MKESLRVNMIKQWYAKTIDLLKRWKIYIGIDTHKAPPYSIVIFPLFHSTLCCGFAGVLSVKKGEKPKDAEHNEKFIRLFQEIKQRDMKSLLSGVITSSEYLNGGGKQKELEEILLQQKRDIPTQQIFFHRDKTLRLHGIIEEMKAFLAEEEKILEENAGHFQSVDMEIINSRLILMKDVIWSLEKDILGNVEKIRKIIHDNQLELNDVQIIDPRSDEEEKRRRPRKPRPVSLLSGGPAGRTAGRLRHEILH